jgi:hypothetical protein
MYFLHIFFTAVPQIEHSVKSNADFQDAIVHDSYTKHNFFINVTPFPKRDNIVGVIGRLCTVVMNFNASPPHYPPLQRVSQNWFYNCY